VDAIGAGRQGNAEIADFEDGLDGVAHEGNSVIPTGARRAEWRDLLSTTNTSNMKKRPFGSLRSLRVSKKI
jgi:hypothetical protein